MKILYLDLGAGAAGDMLTGALLGLLDASARAAALERINALLPAGVHAAVETAEQCGVTGLRFRVTVHGAEEGEDKPSSGATTPHQSASLTASPQGEALGGAEAHAHAHAADIDALIAGMALTDDERAAVQRVYRAVAAAESEVHGVPVAQVHLHELGALDALADVTAFTVLLGALGGVRVAASGVAVGDGTVRCAHGVLPVPAPATALLLRGIPAFAGPGGGELCTPTGAALVRTFVTDFGPLPAMTIERVGYGFGTKQFPDRPNCVRAILGETSPQSASLTAPLAQGSREAIIALACNLDDMTAEDVGFALEQLYAAGAVEAYTTPAGMKKNRPGVVLTALCREAQREAVLRAFFTYTSTLGVREQVLTRHTLSRRTRSVETAFGPVQRKDAEGFGTVRGKWEYEDVARIARERGLSPAQVRRALDREYGDAE